MTCSVADLRARLGNTFPAVDAVFDDCAAEAMRLLPPEGVEAWLEAARFLGGLGRGAEPMLVYLEEAPIVADLLGVEALERLKAFAYRISRTPNSGAIVPFLQTAATAARRLETLALFDRYLELVARVMDDTTTSVHGIVATHPSPCLVDFLGSVPTLLEQLSLGGLRNWIQFGIEGFANDPDAQSDYFALQASVAHTVLQRERHGTLLVDHERLFDLYLRAIWGMEARLRPYSLLFDEIRKPQPYLDDGGIHLPDVYDDCAGVRGVDRYRASLAHIAAHHRWTTPIIADNLSPFQQVATEAFEDMRVEWLALRHWPGLRRLWLALHPRPAATAPEDACDLHHRLARFSRAMLDPEYGRDDAPLRAEVARLRAVLEQGSDTQAMADFAIRWYVRTRKASDTSTTLFLDDVEVSYRDDNRHMWRYIEADDEDFAPQRRRSDDDASSEHELPPRHYDEWDEKAQRYLPDWVSLYEALHPSASPSRVDAVLARHAHLIKRLRNLIDMLKPQNKVRIRFQEEGTELDLDVAIRSLVDYRAGAQPDPRINMSHRSDGRSIAISLLLDLSVSLNETAPGCGQTILELSQEAVSLLAWSVQRAGDPLAIGGFHSNTRHDVRYYHIKGFSESWNEAVKGRIAAMEGAYSTRMGAAIRHAGALLQRQEVEKRLLLVLTDGRPHDIDVKDEAHLLHDTRKAVQEAERAGLHVHCVSLDPEADAYVADIFGHHYTVIDRAERLPERLPELFLKLTK